MERNERNSTENKVFDMAPGLLLMGTSCGTRKRVVLYQGKLADNDSDPECCAPLWIRVVSLCTALAGPVPAAPLGRCLMTHH